MKNNTETTENISTTDASDSSKYHVPNLERALQMMELLAHSPTGLGITDMSALLDISKNSTFRIAMTLLDFGYLIRDEASKQFTLSGKLLSLGYAAVSDENLIEKSLDIMRELRNVVRETVLIGVMPDNEGVVMDQVPGLHPVKFMVDPGTRFPLHCAAPAKAMMAYLPDPIFTRLCDSMTFTRFNARTITNQADFLLELEQVRATGYALDRAEQIDSLHCVAAPIFDRHGFPVASIWTTGPAERLTPDHFSQFGPIVRQHADRISKRLGHYPKPEPNE